MIKSNKNVKAIFTIEFKCFNNLFLPESSNLDSHLILNDLYLLHSIDKIDCQKTFNLEYFTNSRMTNPQIVEHFIATQAKYISELPIESTFIAIAHLTKFKDIIKDYFNKTYYSGDTVEIISDEYRKDPLLARHSEYTLNEMKPLLFLLYSILNEDGYETFDTVYKFNEWCLENSDKTLEYLILRFNKKQQLKDSQLRFLALDIEKKLIYNYVYKFNEIILNSPKIKHCLHLYSNFETLNNSLINFDVETKDIYYPLIFTSLNFQQSKTNDDSLLIESVKYDKKEMNYLFPDSNIIKNLKVTNKGIYSICRPNEARDITKKIKQFVKKHFIPQESILDATAGLGGNVLDFIQSFKNVYANEYDSTTFEYLKNNIKEYRKTLGHKYHANVNFYNSDITNLLKKMNNNIKIDIIYIDPPWGGKDYKTNINVVYKIGNEMLNEVVKLALEKIQLAVIRVGINIDLKQFLSIFSRKEYIISIERFKTSYLIAITKKYNNSEDIERELQIQNTDDINEKEYEVQNTIDILISENCHQLCLNLFTNSTKLDSIVLPNSTLFERDTLGEVNYRVKKTFNFPTTDRMFALFSHYFENDLIGWKHKHSQPKWIVKGGYALQNLLKYKYDIPNLKITNDIDINVSLKNINNKQNYIQYVIHKVKEFFKSTSLFYLFSTELYIFEQPIYNKVEKSSLSSLLLIRYKTEPFIDIGFVDHAISEQSIDWNISQKCGYPIKNSEAYMKEIVSLVYQENVPKADVFTYKKRNLFTGTFYKKGIKDIERSKLMCELDMNIYDQYKRYCDHVETLAIKDDTPVSNLDFKFLSSYFEKKINRIKDFDL
jgi:16S rRNA G966 N2-methylase RsmD